MHLSIELLSGISFIGAAGLSYYVFSKYKKPSTDYEPQNNIKEELENDADNQCFEADNLHTTQLKSIEELYKDAVVENQVLRELLSKQDLTIERTRRLPLGELHQDPGLWAAYVRGWEDRTADVHLNIRVWNPSPTPPTNHPDTANTSLTERANCGQREKTGEEETETCCPVRPNPCATNKKKSTGQMTRQKKRDMARMAEFLAKKRGQQIGQPPTTLQQDTIVNRSTATL